MFSTERLTARLWQHSDAERAFDTYSRWEVARWLGATPKALESPAEAPAMIDRWRQRSADPRYGIWALERKDTGVVVGSVILIPLTDPDGTGDGEIEVGWHLHPDSWGHGFATEAATAALAKGFADGLTEIHAMVRPGNDRSAAVCRRLGMTPQGRTTHWYGGTEFDAFLATRP
ncbi:GNAT family N-acetyltransferase [Streptomyces sp. NRRL S-495]|uniref:GNAT family N-acetyltransferase n=1 Tax=Streptomyces sp. NRRL S-495 TaxID=1609133 RepID=UPI0005F96088|nr:GNAT family N-acetyltransferase [Streptomyces sp. NRRL S-495]KJY32298.1 acetyltransferase [Streptomyces sp. NRRL S-495]